MNMKERSMIKANSRIPSFLIVLLIMSSLVFIVYEEKLFETFALAIYISMKYYYYIIYLILEFLIFLNQAILFCYVNYSLSTKYNADMMIA